METLEKLHTFLLCFLILMELPVIYSSKNNWSAIWRLILYIFCLILTCFLLVLSIIVREGILFILLCTACVFLIIRSIKNAFSELKNQNAHKHNNEEPEIEILPAPPKPKAKSSPPPVIIDVTDYIIIEEE